jgi:hypothetical protein
LLVREQLLFSWALQAEVPMEFFLETVAEAELIPVGFASTHLWTGCWHAWV